MSHETQNLIYHQGDTIPLEFEVTDNGKPTTDPFDPGTAVDIASAGEIVFRVAADATDAVALIEKTLSVSGVTITNGAGGQFEVALVEGDTSGLDGVYHYEARLTMAGLTETIKSGLFTVEPTVG